MAFHHLGAHAEHDALDARFLGLLGDGEQRLFERQAGLHERGELAREQRQIGCGDAAAHGEAAIAFGLAVFDLGHGDRQQLPFAQQLPHMFDGIAFDNPVLFAARGIEGGVFEGTHVTNLVFARDAQYFFDCGFAAQDAIEAIVPDGGGHRARVALELVLRGFVVNHRPHLHRRR